MRLVQGSLGRGIYKTSAVDDDRQTIEAPAAVFHTQEDVITAFKAGKLNRDVIVVVRFQGPDANGMPELHRLTPTLAVLQDKGYRVALLTDGRMSGASGKVPAAIHICPEAQSGGPIACIEDGDILRICARRGEIEALVDPAIWEARKPAQPPLGGAGTGRELFTLMRSRSDSAEKGGSAMLAAMEDVMDSHGAELDKEDMHARHDNAGRVMTKCPVIPVLVIPDLSLARPIAQALVAGGLTTLEVTLRTECALEAIREMSKVEGAHVGAGTVLNGDDLSRAVDAGAQFIVSPGLTSEVAAAAQRHDVPLLPGVANAGDIMRGLDLGLSRFKFFPAMANGGLPA